jgi:hypothetical protein
MVFCFIEDRRITHVHLEYDPFGLCYFRKTDPIFDPALSIMGDRFCVLPPSDFET